jgi:hypothetical protein
MNGSGLVATLGILAIGAGAGAQYSLRSSTIDGGGGTLIGGTYAMSGTAGQADASGVSVGAEYALAGGFWAPPACPCAADLDGNCTTDVFDFTVFATGFGSSGLAPYTGGDLDGDGDVDVFDFTVYAIDFGCGG